MFNPAFRELTFEQVASRLDVLEDEIHACAFASFLHGLEPNLDDPTGPYLAIDGVPHKFSFNADKQHRVLKASVVPLYETSTELLPLHRTLTSAGLIREVSITAPRTLATSCEKALGLLVESLLIDYRTLEHRFLSSYDQWQSQLVNGLTSILARAFEAKSLSSLSKECFFSVTTVANLRYGIHLSLAQMESVLERLKNNDRLFGSSPLSLGILLAVQDNLDDFMSTELLSPSEFRVMPYSELPVRSEKEGDLLFAESNIVGEELAVQEICCHESMSLQLNLPASVKEQGNSLIEEIREELELEFQRNLKSYASSRTMLRALSEKTAAGGKTALGTIWYETKEIAIKTAAEFLVRGGRPF